MKKHSIRLELIGFCVAIVLVSMGLQIGFNTIFGRQISIFQKEQQIQTLYTKIIDNYSDDANNLSEIIGNAHDIENIKVHISGPNGMIYAGDYPAMKLPSMPAKEMIPSLRDIAKDKAPPVDTDKEVAFLTESFTYEGETRTVEIWSSVIAIDDAVNLYATVNILVSAVLILCSIGAVLFFSKRITKPVVEIETVAKNVAKLDFSTQANENVHAQEFSSLALSINTMSRELSSMIDKLSAENQDLTLKVEYQKQMEQMRRQFVANISHEMKTPLAMLMMYSESLQMNVEGIDKDYYCQTIQEEAAGLNDMVAQLLDISAIENGLSQMHRESMNFSDFVTSVVAKSQVLLADYQVTVDIAPELWIDGDSHYLEQAIRNFLSNAKSHTEKGKKIAIRLQQNGKKTIFSVENQGNPISEDDMPYLWDSFYRGDKSRTQNGQKRVGLGLYLVKTCIQAHHGEVKAENTLDSVIFSFSI